MLQLKNILTIHPFYKKRIKRLQQTKTFITSVDKLSENALLFTGKSDTGHTIEIEIHRDSTDKFSINSPVKVFCDCHSFKFEFAHTLFRAGALRNKLSFIRSIIQRPKKKNPNLIVGVCKHVISLANQIKPKISNFN